MAAMTDLVLTLIGPDRPGLVESVAERVTAHGGNWLESRMARLAGQFAGILRVEVPAEGLAGLKAALGALEGSGLRVLVGGAEAAAAAQSVAMELQALGADHPGIVRDVARVLARHGVNIVELVTDRVDAPMAGGLLFKAQARLRVPAGLDARLLREDLERLANDLMVDLKLVQSVLGREGRG
jgi:glycine cleavage system regulatory protein